MMLFSLGTSSAAVALAVAADEEVLQVEGVELDAARVKPPTTCAIAPRPRLWHHAAAAAALLLVFRRYPARGGGGGTR